MNCLTIQLLFQILKSEQPQSFPTARLSPVQPPSHRRHTTMIPDNKDNQRHDTPKAFNTGYYFRETFDLFGCGWRAASRNLKEYYRMEEAKENRKYIVELLEEGLYDSASRGTQEQQLEALNYFLRKKNFEQQQDQRPYTWGEQITSLGNAGLRMVLVAALATFAANWSCGSSQSRFCSNIRANTTTVIQHFVEPKN